MKQIITLLTLFHLALATDCEAKSRKKVIDFEDTLVEGVNKRPLDSLSQVSEKDSHKNLHLYKKRKGFSGELYETFTEFKLIQ